MSCKGRVLCVTSNFPRWVGDSTTPFVLHLAHDLQSLGWAVDVLAPHAPDCAISETIEGVRVERFRYMWPAAQQSVCYQGGALVNLRKHRGNLLKLPPLVFAEWAAIMRRLAGGRYDLLHSHWMLPQGFAGVLAAKTQRVPHVITVHGGDAFALRGSFLARFKRFALRHADAVTVNSSVTEVAVRQLGPGLTPVHRIPMGVSIARVSSESPDVVGIKARYCHADGPLLVFVGRVVEEKGVRDLIDAVATLRADLPDVRALVIGEGQDRAELEIYTATIGLAEHVKFTGWVQSVDVPNYMAAADIFVGPSRQSGDGWVEAQGLTFLEAMVAGVPVIATRLGGIVDSIENGVTGILVDERAPAQIANAVRFLVADARFTAQLVEAARADVISRFSRLVSAESFSDLFSDLCLPKRS